MMHMKTKSTEMNGRSTTAAAGGGGGENEWEVRPGGMLVQKRDLNDEHTRIPPPTIRVRVKFGSVSHEINISSQATFGNFITYLIMYYFSFLIIIFKCYLRLVVLPYMTSVCFQKK